MEKNAKKVVVVTNCLILIVCMLSKFYNHISKYTQY